MAPVLETTARLAREAVVAENRGNFKEAEGLYLSAAELALEHASKTPAHRHVLRTRADEYITHVETLRCKHELAPSGVDVTAFKTKAAACIEKATSAEQHGDFAQAIQLYETEIEEQLATLNLLDAGIDRTFPNISSYAG
eukprot:462370-Prorocentrum_minimum.AAC.2